MTALIANHVFSFAVVMVAWWNAHLTASSREPLARISAIGYGAVAVFTLVVAFFRQFDIDPEWLAVGYKVALAGLFVTIALRKDARARRAAAAGSQWARNL